MGLVMLARIEHTADQLIAFEQRVAEAFNNEEIRAPVHLSGGNEKELIEIFGEIKSDDWVCSTWRSHYHCLLHGVPEDQLMADILAGRSISLCYPEYRIISSAIVAGCLPIAVGLAMAIKAAGKNEHVWAFIGDMAATTGMFHECTEYAYNHTLPITFVVEDNGKSVCTNTEEAWGGLMYPGRTGRARSDNIIYTYSLPWPHAGAGKRVQF
jgi:TPP-dependent pyruvate/acetoin dehydrogenase alpha subunit